MLEPHQPEPPVTRRPRGFYLLPNLFTTTGLFAGFYAIVAAMKGYFDLAAIGIFVAMVMDILDGRVARLTNTQSAFGAQYDSLSDMVSFGIAPALVVYSWALGPLGKIGWLIAFFFTATAALRLARFNTQVGHGDKRFFVGLPSPAAAGVVAGMVAVGSQVGIETKSLSALIGGVTFCVAALMVSNLRYYSFKDIDLRGKVPFMALLVVVLVFVGIAADPPWVLFSVFSLYACYGPCWSLWRFAKGRMGSWR